MIGLSEYRKYRLLEMIPGLLVWTIFLLALLFSMARPLWVLGFIIVYDVYWLVRAYYTVVFVLIAYARFRTASKIRWQDRTSASPERSGRIATLRHLVVIPTYGDPLELLRTTIHSLTEVDFPIQRQMVVVLAGEEREGTAFQEKAHALAGEFAGFFLHFMVTVHPGTIPGEIAGKGSNIHWAGKRAQEWIDAQGYAYEDVVVSSFDSDTIAHPQYFSYLSYMYATLPNPVQRSYQPIPLFTNNVWDAHAIMRVVSAGTTFWLLGETLRPERMLTFSSHSMSFKALVEVGFWQNDIVTEDSRIALQGIIRYDGDYIVTPLYIPLTMDTVHGHSFWQSVKNQYKQIRRWAYGVENFPYMVWHFAGNRRIPFIKKFRYMFNLLEGVVSWATAAILVLALGRVPFYFTSEADRQTAIYQNTPLILEVLVNIALITLLVSAIFNMFLLPPLPRSRSFTRYSIMLFQWLLFPVSIIVFGSIPAIDAQTRLMLGRYLGFFPTPKIRHLARNAGPDKGAVPT